MTVEEQPVEEKIQDKATISQELFATPGHPLASLHEENQALEGILADCRQALKSGEGILENFKRLGGISSHYSKKGDLIYPNLEAKYGITGPSNVMWTVDVDIRNDLRHALKKGEDIGKRPDLLEDLLEEIESMIYKEDNILFPNAAANFSQEDWVAIYRDQRDYGMAFGVEDEAWAPGEAGLREAHELEAPEGDIQIPGGSFSAEELTAMLNTMPIEITFVDKDNINKYFNQHKGKKYFKRPLSALGRDVMTCHPVKVQTMVEMIIDDFKNKRRDNVPVWMEKEGKPFYVNYMAVRNDEGDYLGVMELVTDMTFARDHFEKEKK